MDSMVLYDTNQVDCTTVTMKQTRAEAGIMKKPAKICFKSLATTCASSYKRGIDTREIDVLSAAIFNERVYSYSFYSTEYLM